MSKRTLTDTTSFYFIPLRCCCFVAEISTALTSVSNIHQARFSHVLMNRAQADQKRCFLPSLTASCTASCFNSMFPSTHITAQGHTCTLLLNNTFHILIKICGGSRVFSVLFFISYWCIIYLQCCVSFRCTAKLYIYLYLFFVRFFSHTGYQRTLSRDLCAIQ